MSDAKWEACARCGAAVEQIGDFWYSYDGSGFCEKKRTPSDLALLHAPLLVVAP